MVIHIQESNLVIQARSEDFQKIEKEKRKESRKERLYTNKEIPPAQQEMQMVYHRRGIIKQKGNIGIKREKGRLEKKR